MGKTIVFLNLADNSKYGLAQTTLLALQGKYAPTSGIEKLLFKNNTVHRVDLFDFMPGSRDAKSGGRKPAPCADADAVMPTAGLPTLAKERSVISALCARADKIMLGVHGKVGDSDNAYFTQGFGTPMTAGGNYVQYATLLKSLLPPRRRYHLALVMCFGARAQDPSLDHDRPLNAMAIRSSFAYKFYRELTLHANFFMTARTGSVSFDWKSGKSEVQSEVGVKAELEDLEFQAAAATHAVTTAYKDLRDSMSRRDSEMDAFERLCESMAEPGARPRNANEKIVHNYQALQQKAYDLNGKKVDAARKQGKFVYQFEAGKNRLTVCRKYEDGKKVMRVLYSGPP